MRHTLLERLRNKRVVKFYECKGKLVVEECNNNVFHAAFTKADAEHLLVELKDLVETIWPRRRP